MKGNDEVSVMLLIYVLGHSQAVINHGDDQADDHLHESIHVPAASSVASPI